MAASLLFALHQSVIVHLQLTGAGLHVVKTGRQI